MSTTVVPLLELEIDPLKCNCLDKVTEYINTHIMNKVYTLSELRNDLKATYCAQVNIPVSANMITVTSDTEIRMESRKSNEVVIIIDCTPSTYTIDYSTGKSQLETIVECANDFAQQVMLSEDPALISVLAYFDNDNFKVLSNKQMNFSEISVDLIDKYRETGERSDLVDMIEKGKWLLELNNTDKLIKSIIIFTDGTESTSKGFKHHNLSIVIRKCGTISPTEHFGIVPDQDETVECDSSIYSVGYKNIPITRKSFRKLDLGSYLALENPPLRLLKQICCDYVEIVECDPQVLDIIINKQSFMRLSNDLYFKNSTEQIIKVTKSDFSELVLLYFRSFNDEDETLHVLNKSIKRQKLIKSLSLKQDLAEEEVKLLQETTTKYSVSIPDANLFENFARKKFARLFSCNSYLLIVDCFLLIDLSQGECFDLLENDDYLNIVTELNTFCDVKKQLQSDQVPNVNHLHLVKQMTVKNNVKIENRDLFQLFVQKLDEIFSVVNKLSRDNWYRTSESEYVIHFETTQLSLYSIIPTLQVPKEFQELFQSLESLVADFNLKNQSIQKNVDWHFCQEFECNIVINCQPIDRLESVLESMNNSVVGDGFKCETLIQSHILVLERLSDYQFVIVKFHSEKMWSSQEIPETTLTDLVEKLQDHNRRELLRELNETKTINEIFKHKHLLHQQIFTINCYKRRILNPISSLRLSQFAIENSVNAYSLSDEFFFELVDSPTALQLVVYSIVDGISVEDLIQLIQQRLLTSTIQSIPFLSQLSTNDIQFIQEYCTSKPLNGQEEVDYLMDELLKHPPGSYKQHQQQQMLVFCNKQILLIFPINNNIYFYYFVADGDLFLKDLFQVVESRITLDKELKSSCKLSGDFKCCKYVYTTSFEYCSVMWLSISDYKAYLEDGYEFDRDNQSLSYYVTETHTLPLFKHGSQKLVFVSIHFKSNTIEIVGYGPSELEFQNKFIHKLEMLIEWTAKRQALLRRVLSTQLHNIDSLDMSLVNNKFPVSPEVKEVDLTVSEQFLQKFLHNHRHACKDLVKCSFEWLLENKKQQNILLMHSCLQLVPLTDVYNNDILQFIRQGQSGNQSMFQTHVSTNNNILSLQITSSTNSQTSSNQWYHLNNIKRRLFIEYSQELLSLRQQSLQSTQSLLTTFYTNALMKCSTQENRILLITYLKDHYNKQEYSLVEEKEMNAKEMSKYLRKHSKFFKLTPVSDDLFVRDCLPDVPPYLLNNSNDNVLLIIDTTQPIFLFKYYYLGNSQVQKYLQTVIDSIVAQSLRFFARDSLWRRLINSTNNKNDKFTLTEFLVLSTRYSTVLISEFDSSLTQQLADIPLPTWSSIVKYLPLFYGRYLLFENAPDLHLILINPANNDLLVHFHLNTKTGVQVYAVSREWRSVDKFSNNSGNDFSNQELSFISDIITTISFLLLIQ